MKLNLYVLVLISVLLTGNEKVFCADSLVTFHTYWRYMDNGVQPPANWTSLSYVDTSWHIGQAEFGYGDGDETTVISYGPDANNKYITSYFRHEFLVNNVSAYRSLILLLKRDDAAVVYINGQEVYRSNLATGSLSSSRLSQSNVNGSEENEIIISGTDLSLLNNGYNLISAELHQNSPTGSDASFDLALIADTGTMLMRGPYLQMATKHTMMVCWRTASPEISKVLIGNTLSFTDTIIDTVKCLDHFLNVTGLQPSTKYFYAVCSEQQVLHTDSDTYFITAPDSNTTGRTRIWAMGDFGTGSILQNLTRNAYYNYADTTYTNIFLMLGDNAYAVGSDENYSVNIFHDHYEGILKKTVSYSTCGNHELLSATASNQTGPYYDIYSLPKNAECGGVASGTEAYYSFDYADIHFVCLESNVDSFGSANLSTMLTWLDSDLTANNKKWTIAYYHFPPLSKGYHDSDHNNTEIWCRENINPVLEHHNVDLVLGGHSHDYERSHLLKGHYGISTTLLPSMIIDSTGGASPCYDKRAVQDSGTVYAVVGSSSEITPIQPDWPHPAMYNSNSTTYGSMVIDVTTDTMDVKFLTYTDSIADHFLFVKSSPAPPVISTELTRGPYLQSVAPSEITIRWATSTPITSRLLFGSSMAYSDSITDTSLVTEHTARLQGLQPYSKYYYAIRLSNDSLISDSSYYFYTAPVEGSVLPLRFWAMGSFGTGDTRMDNIRDAYLAYSASQYTNLLLWLGNNSYPTGSSHDYDDNVFSHFNQILKSTCVYSAMGRNELSDANPSTGTGDYFDLFNFPKHGEAGGLASGSESYYSFNYGNIHFVCLESNIDSFGFSNLNIMINWLNADLTANSQKWTVVFMHNPPYTKASFDSDNESNMINCRTIFVPILEAHNVDLILASNSDAYERSVLLKEHYGPASTYDPAVMASDTSSGTPPLFYDKSLSTTKGAVYTTIGSIAAINQLQSGWPHPAMYTSIDSTDGSLVIDVSGDTLSVKFLTSSNSVADAFGILRHSAPLNITTASAENFIVFPDPVGSNLYVQYSGDEKDISMVICNSFGQVVKSNVLDNTSHFYNVDLSHFSNGVYFIRLQGKKTNLVKKIIKN